MANDVKLLLVEDNPMVLGMLQQALSPLAVVTAASESADALLKAVDDPPDLVVCDYRLPGMDGRQLIEKLKSRPKTANFSAVLMANKADIAERLSPQDAADDYLEKPFFLREAVKRIKRMIDRAASMSLDEALDYEVFMQEAAGRTQDYTNAVEAFKEKRKPEYTGK